MTEVLFEARRPWWAELAENSYLLVLPVLAFAAGHSVFAWLYLAAETLIAVRLKLRGDTLILRVEREVLEYPTPYSRQLRQVRAHEVERIEWNGFDNVGIRLQDGRVVSASFLEVPKPKREAAHAAIVSFVARARGAA